MLWVSAVGAWDFWLQNSGRIRCGVYGLTLRGIELG